MRGLDLRKSDEIEEEFKRSERRIQKIAEEEIKKIADRVKSIEREAERVGKDAEDSLRKEESVDEVSDST